MRRNLRFFHDNADRIVILSGGFREIIAPLAAQLHVPPERVLCNDLIYDAEGRVTGVDQANPLAHADGKSAPSGALAFPGPVVMIGDGWTDAEVRLAGRRRPLPRLHRDRPPRAASSPPPTPRSPSMDELLHAEGLAGRWSYPRAPHPHPAAGEHPPRRRRTAARRPAIRSRRMKGALDEDALIEALQGRPRAGHPLQDPGQRPRAGGRPTG